MVEDVWGEIEHILGYKPNKRTSFAVKKHFSILSTLLHSVDDTFNLLYEELARFQEEIVVRDSDPLNAENLPVVLSELGLGCSQSEINGLLKLLVSRGIHVVGELRKVATVTRLEIIRNTYRTVAGREPKNFEVIASIAAIATVSEADHNEVTEQIKLQIEFLKAWDNLKRQN